jgi:hypothetical protein
MSESLSSTFVYALSSIYKSEFLNFINTEREISYVENTDYSAAIDISYPEFSKYISDIRFKNSYFTFLTSVSRLSSYFNSLQGFGGNYYGSRMQDFTVKYDWIINNFTTTASAYEDTQFLGIMDREANFNFIPLKSKISINNEQYSTVDNYKFYEKIYDINDSLFLQFRVDKIPVEIFPDRYNTVFNSYNVSARYINDTEFVKNGGIGGNCPLNSDVILFDTSEYGKYTNNGPNNINSFNNGTLLCLWLSSQTVEPDSQKIWMERWYDPNTVTNGNAFISQKNNSTNSLTYIFDIPSTKILSPKEKFVYLRYGNQRNRTFVNSISSNLKIHFDGWSKNFKSVDESVQGYVVGNYPLSSTNLNLDGTIHAHIPPEDPLFVEKDLTLGIWANSFNWKFNVDSQFFGNFNNESGYGLFYNTGVPNNLISIPTKSNNLFALNYKGFKVFEKDLKNDLALSSINIEYIKTDLFGNRWLYDSENQHVYKVENDDLVINKIDLPINAQITKIDCNSNNEVYLFDNFNKALSAFDADGILLSTQNVSSHFNTFEIDKNDNVILDSAEFITVNSYNEVVKIVGSTLLVNNERVLHLTDKPTTIRIDSENNIWILLKNQIIKTDPKGELLFTKTIDVGFTDYSAEMGFVKIFKNSLEEIQLWIIFNSGKYIVILDLNGRIVKRIDLVPLFVGNQCSQFQLNIQGDFCGFDSRRKYEIVNDKPISPFNPAFSVKVSLTNGISKKIVQVHSSTEFVDQWTHVAFSIENKLNSTVIKLFVDGRLQNSKTISGNYRIDYSYRSTPFIIGGISGKLGAKNLEKSIVDVGYFIGQINDIRLYDRVLNDYEIMNLALYRYYTDWRSSFVYMSVPPITMVEEIDTFHLNRYKGFKSNYFNVKIGNFTDDEKVQEVVRQYITSEIDNWVPANTILNSIKFE